MKKYIIQEQNLLRVREIIEISRKRLKERNLAMLNRGLMELYDIFLNIKELKQHESDQ